MNQSPTQSDKTFEQIVQELALNQQFLGEQYGKDRIDELTFDARDTEYRENAIAALTARENRMVQEARIDEWERQTKDNAFDEPITPENQNDPTWQGGYNFARNSWKRKKLERIATLTSQQQEGSK